MLQVVFATAVTKPGHGNIAPLAIGFTLFASAFVGEGISVTEVPRLAAQHAHCLEYILRGTLSEAHLSCSGLMQADPPQEPP